MTGLLHVKIGKISSIVVRFLSGGRTVPIPLQSPLQVGRECYLRALGRALIVEVLGVSGDTVWISCPSAGTLEEGTGVELEFHYDEGFVGYHARVAVVARHPADGIVLERCETASFRPERRDWRVPTDFPVWLRRPGSKEKLKGRLIDLTQNGASVATSAPFEAGDALELIFQLPEYAAHQLVAQVVYSDKRASNDVNRFGLRFVDVRKRARNAITWFLYDRIRELYPEELRDLYPRSASRAAARKEAAAQPV